MLSNLKLKIGLSQLQKRLKTFQRKKMVYNFESARKVGILIASSADAFDHAMQLQSFLTAKRIESTTLIFCTEKEIPQKYFLRKGVSVFSKKELNWYGKPISSVAEEFINTNYDILIDLSMTESFPLRWISSLSKAKFKVGTLQYYGNPNDLVISISKEKGIDYLIEQIIHYLSILNNRFAQEENWNKDIKIN